MLYQLYETQRALMSPFSEFASATAKLYNHPLSPSRAQIAAGAAHRGGLRSVAHRLAKDYEKPEFNIKTVNVGGDRRGHPGTGGHRPSRSASCCALSASPTSLNVLSDAQETSPPCWWWRRCPATTPPCCATPCASC
jgi:hypothetical protein